MNFPSGPVVAIACLIVAAAIGYVAVRQAIEDERRRQRRARSTEFELRPGKVWALRARVPRAQLEPALIADYAQGQSGRLADWLTDLEIEMNPPASGPEVELRWRLLAATDDQAESIARRQLDRLGLTTLAIAADEFVRVR